MKGDEMTITQEIVDGLRDWADDKRLEEEEVYIPDGCEKYGFMQGYFKVKDQLRFLADMLEE
jgi:hypothetical protein